MQRAEDSSSRLAPDPARSALKPTTAFVLLLLVITAIGALVFLTRPTPAPQPTGTTTAIEPSFALTNDEAIARFEDLAKIRQRAYASHDISLLGSLYTRDSLVGPMAAKELRKLNRDGVSDLSDYDTQVLEVITNASREIKLREVVVVTPRFVEEGGENVTVNAPTAREVVTWTLRLENNQWLIYDALITDSRPIN